MCLAPLPHELPILWHLGLSPRLVRGHCLRRRPRRVVEAAGCVEFPQSLTTVVPLAPLQLGLPLAPCALNGILCRVYYTLCGVCLFGGSCFGLEFDPLSILLFSLSSLL